MLPADAPKETNNIRDNDHNDNNLVEKRFESPVDRVEVNPVDESSLNKLARTSLTSSTRKLVKIPSHNLGLDESNLTLGFSGTSSSKVLNIKNLM